MFYTQYIPYSLLERLVFTEPAARAAGEDGAETGGEEEKTSPGLKPGPHGQGTSQSWQGLSAIIIYIIEISKICKFT